MPDKAKSRILRAALIQPGDAGAEYMPTSIEEADEMTKEDIYKIRDAFVAKICELIQDAAEQNADLICLGELCTAPYFALETREIWKHFAESADEDGYSIGTFIDLSRNCELVIAAPIYEITESGERYNTTVIIDNGEIIGKYRKTHIPNGGNEQASFHEAFYYDAARVTDDYDDLFRTFETSAGRIAVRTCYDRHFYESMKRARDDGAEILFCPAITFGRKSKNMWTVESAAWAGGVNAFALFMNRFEGEKGPWKKQEFFGDNHAMSSLAERVTPKLGSQSPYMVLVDLDLSMTRKDQSGWNLPRDERPTEDYFSRA
jgi:beta-ureidopropionase